MQRFILGVFLAVGWLAVTAGPAAACLWDKEVVGHEKQFKSSYTEQPATTPSEALPSLAQRLGSTGGLLGGLGVLMLVGAMVVGFARGKSLKQTQPENPAGGNSP